MKFESIIILIENIKNEEKEKLLKEIKKFIKKPTVEEWGVKRKGFPIKGYYIIVNFEEELKNVKRLEEFYKKDSNIIKYITVIKG